MPTGYQIYNQKATYYLTLQVVFWIDIFTRKIYRDIIIESLKHCQKEKGLEIYALVIMSNHVHLLVRSSKGELSGTIRDFKKHTSKKIVKDIITSKEESRKIWILNLLSNAAKMKNKKSRYQLWTHENHAIEVFSNSFIEEKITYIHNNPVRSDIVQYPEEYIYSSAKFYAGEESILEIIPVDFRWKTS